MASDTTAEFFDVTAKRVTDMALLVEIDGEEVWIPKSVIHDDSEVFDDSENSTGTLIVKKWWAEKEGLI